MGGRHYLIKGWQNASEYSGEQIGNRLKRSTNIYNADGTANLNAFAEPEKTKALESDRVLNCPFSKLDKQEDIIRGEYLKGLIDESKLGAALFSLENKRYQLASKQEKKEQERLKVKRKLEQLDIVSHNNNVAGYDTSKAGRYDIAIGLTLLIALLTMIFTI